MRDATIGSCCVRLLGGGCCCERFLGCPDGPQVERITSDALMMAVTAVPRSKPSSSAASTVIEATMRCPLASSSTFATASPFVIFVTVPLIWLRALIGMASSPRGMDRPRRLPPRPPGSPGSHHRRQGLRLPASESYGPPCRGGLARTPR